LDGPASADGDNITSAGKATARDAWPWATVTDAAPAEEAGTPVVTNENTHAYCRHDSTTADHSMIDGDLVDHCGKRGNGKPAPHTATDDDTTIRHSDIENGDNAPSAGTVTAAICNNAVIAARTAPTSAGAIVEDAVGCSTCAMSARATAVRPVAAGRGT
jgi:hypothetical protein